MSNNNNASSGISFGSLLFLTFLILKLTHTIDWSWWWVTSPIWIPLIIVLIILGIFILIRNLL